MVATVLKMLVRAIARARQEATRPLAVSQQSVPTLDGQARGAVVIGEMRLPPLEFRLTVLGLLAAAAFAWHDHELTRRREAESAVRIADAASRSPNGVATGTVSVLNGRATVFSATGEVIGLTPECPAPATGRPAGARHHGDTNHK